MHATPIMAAPACFTHVPPFCVVLVYTCPAPCSTDNKMVWGSFWAVLHLLPITRVHWLLRSIVYGLIASTIHLAVVFPAQVNNVL